MEDTKPNIGKQIAYVDNVHAHTYARLSNQFQYFPILYANYIVHHLFTEWTQFIPFISM